MALIFGCRICGRKFPNASAVGKCMTLHGALRRFHPALIAALAHESGGYRIVASCVADATPCMARFLVFTNEILTQTHM
jgi:hypothetical protein